MSTDGSISTSYAGYATTEPAGKVTAAGLKTTNATIAEIRAAKSIQRAYRRHRLEQEIRHLKTTEPWFFQWQRYSANPQLQLDPLLEKLTSKQFLCEISRLMVMLGFDKDSACCNAKIFLLGFMLNHHGKENSIDTNVSKLIQNMGMCFLRLCEWSSCVIRRVKFLDAFCEFYQAFLNIRGKSMACLMPKLLSQMADTVTMWHRLMDSLNTGRIKQERCCKTLNTLHDRSKMLMSTIKCIVGSTASAKRLVHLEMAKRRFLKELDAEKFCNKEVTCDKNRQYRSAGMLLVLDPNFKGVRVESREEKHDCHKDPNSVMRTQYHSKLGYIKHLIRSNFELSHQQEQWVPSFINHVRFVLNMMDKELHVDDECIAQQCSKTGYNLVKLVHQVIVVARPHDASSVDLKLAELDKQVEQGVVTQELLFNLLNRLDDLRVEKMDWFFRCNAQRLTSMARHNELQFFIQDVKAHKLSIQNLLSWAFAARHNSQETRMDKMRCHFANTIVAFPSHTHLNTFPETFKHLRLAILRIQIKVRDIALAFCIVHFAAQLFGQFSGNLKQTILDVLGRDAQLASSEIVTQICQAVEQEHPCISAEDGKLLKVLVSKRVRCNNTNSCGDAVLKLALQRIKQSVQHELEGTGSTEQCNFHGFHDEVRCVAVAVRKVWEVDTSIYGVVYETVCKMDALWEKTDDKECMGEAMIE